MVVRVLHVVTKMDAGGLETFIMNLYRNVDREKVQFDFLVHREKAGFYDDEIYKLGGKIYKVPKINPLQQKHYINSLDEFFINHKEYKIVHSHINAYSMWILRSAEKENIPVRIAHSHISSVPVDYKTPFRIYCKSKIQDYTTNQFACGEKAGNWLYGKDSDFVVINNAIDIDKFQYREKSRNKMRKEFNIENNFVIGHVGRFSEQKNHNFMIEVFKEIVDKNKDSVLLLVGDGELKEKIRNTARDLDVVDNVIFAGVRSDIAQLLQGMDVFLMPSLYEGLPVTLIEAQSAGLPIVASNTISKEAKLSNEFDLLSLNQPKTEWANTVLGYKNKERTRDNHEIVKRAGYDMQKNAKKMQNFYLSKYENPKN